MPVRLTTRKATIAVSVAFVLAAGVAVTVVMSRGRADPSPPSRPTASQVGHSAPAAMRTLVVRSGKEPAPSEPGMTMRAKVERGRLPTSPVVARVTSDEDCAPDAHGVSHCLNRLRLPNGRRLAVRHPHRMTEVPCMTPGERVRILGA